MGHVRFQGSVLRRLRTERRWSQSELASRIHAHVTSISDWERGANEPSARHIVSLSAALGVDAGAFYANGNASSDDDEEDALPSLDSVLQSVVEARVAEALAKAGLR